MNNRQMLIKRLLQSFHISVVDRQIFNEQPITLTEIMDCITLELIENKYFPQVASDSKSTYEGHFIEKVNDSEFKLYWQRPNPINPLQVAERHESTYKSLDMLVYDYIDKEYNFNIDGIEINKNGA
jgi:hypothetical protein